MKLVNGRGIGFAVVAMGLLAACSNKQVDSDAADSGGVAQCPPGFYEPLPGFRLDIPFHLQSDKIYRKSGGETRRGLMLEYLSGDAGAAATALDASLAAAGFSPKGERSIDEKGVYRQTFVREESPYEVFVAVFPEPGKGLSNPDAKGKIWLSWKL